MGGYNEWVASDGQNNTIIWCAVEDKSTTHNAGVALLMMICGIGIQSGFV